MAPATRMLTWFLIMLVPGCALRGGHTASFFMIMVMVGLGLGSRVVVSVRIVVKVEVIKQAILHCKLLVPATRPR